jgi:DNA-binding NarL/FixJ family response regulator
MMAYRIVLAEDHIPLRKTIKKILEENTELTVVGEADDGLELLALLKHSLPDMVITDISMPKLRGLEATKIIKNLFPQVKMLILTMHRKEDYLELAMLNGADGFIQKVNMDLELHHAIETVRCGRIYVSPFIEANS